MNLAVVTGLAALLTVGADHQQRGAQGTPSPAPAEQGRPAGRGSSMSAVQGFHVVLVMGEMQPSSSDESQRLPEGAARALNDMREFLPYKHYRVLDAQWSSCCAGPTPRISGRLQGLLSVPGPNGSSTMVHRPYVFSISTTSGQTGIATRFTLTQGEGHAVAHESDAADFERALKNLRDDLATTQVRVEEARRRVESGVAPGLEVREAEDKQRQLQREIEGVQAKLERARAAGATPVIDSSFTMSPGETVVVGTSRLGGDKALIAVLTAVEKTRRDVR